MRNYNSGDQAPTTKHIAEEKIFFAFLKENNTTCTVACNALNIQQKNATRYVDNGKKRNTLHVTHLGVCPCTGRRGVQFLTTNPDLFPPQQPSLFDEGGTP